MKNGILIWLLLGTSYLAQCQKEYHIWCFGNKAGLDFNGTVPVVLSSPQMSTSWGSSSIADTAGNLLFYTNGASVWNRHHQIMKNGTGLLGQPGAITSSLIVRQAFTGIYYIFTCDFSSELPQVNTGVHYSVVDMARDSGRGEVILKNQPLHGESAEKIAAVRHANNRDIWIVTGQIFSDTLHTYLLSDTGLSAPILNRNPGAVLPGGNPGPMKFSPDGKKLAYMDAGYLNNDYVWLLDFNDRTGMLGNPRKIKGIHFGGAIEFSSDSRFLYIADWWNYMSSGGNYMIQTELSRVVKDTHYRAVSDTFAYPASQNGALQLGTDGRLYKNGGFRLMVIENPNERAADLRINLNGPMPASRGSSFGSGFPAMVSSAFSKGPYLISRGRCSGDSVVLKVLRAEPDSVAWNWGDGSRGTHSGAEALHFFRKGGTYTVTALVWTNNLVDTARLTIGIMETKKPFLLSDTIICEGDSVMLNAFDSSYLTYRWSDGTSGPALVAGAAGEYTVTVRDRYCTARDTFHLFTGDPVRVFIGNDTAFCDVFTHVISAGKPFSDYRWNTGDTTFSLTVSNGGTYALRVEDHLSCSATDTVLVTALRRPGLKQFPDTQTCLSTVLSVEREPGIRYRWNTGDTGVSLSISKRGNYMLTQSSLFCSRTDTFSSLILPKPEPDLGPDTMLCFGEITLRSNESGKHTWNTGDERPYIRVGTPGIYILSVSRNGCTASDTVNILACGQLSLYIPDAFTPDGNGHNEVFRIYGEHITDVQLEIYNRWGEMLLRVEGADAQWDGTFEGSACPQGIYLYKVRVTGSDGKREYFSGMLHLLR